MQSLGGQDDIGIERFGVGRRGTSVPSLGPQFGGFQHHIRVNRKIVQNGLETIKPVDAFLQGSADKLAAYFVIRDLRDVNNRTFPEEAFKPVRDLAVGAGMGNLARGPVSRTILVATVNH